MRLPCIGCLSNIYQSINYYLMLCYSFELLGVIDLVIADSASEHLESAKKYLSIGRYNDALPHLDEAIRYDADNYLTYFKRATVFLAINRPKSALDDLNKAIELNNDFTSALIQRASLRVKFGDLDEAHIDYENLLRLEPNNQDAIMMYSRIEQLKEDVMNAQDLMSDNQYNEAAAYLGNLIEAMPYNTEVLKHRAKCLEIIGDVRRAISDYRTIAKLKIDAKVYLNIARMYHKLGEIEESLNNVRECLKLDPDHKSCMDFYKPVKKLNKHITNMLDAKSSKDKDNCIFEGTKAIKTIEQQGIDKQQLRLVYSIQSVMCHCSSQAADAEEGLKICDEALKNSDDGGIEGIAIDKPDLICDKADLLAEIEDYAQALSAYQESQKIKNSERASQGIKRMQQIHKQKKKRDYYKILGVHRRADVNEINKAYRKLAAKWHPDRFQAEEDKKKAQAQFMDIADAKAVLTDAKKRRQFDQGQDPLDPSLKHQGQPHHEFYGDPFGHFGGGAPFSFKFKFS